MKRTQLGLRAGLAVVVMICLGCSNKSKDTTEECATSPEAEKAVPERTVLSKPANGDLDWCRACVVGPHGFMSCQRVTADSATESRGALKARARGKACEDSGFKADACPDDKVIAISCKGDAPPKDKTAAGKAMLNALKTSGPLILKKDAKKPTVIHPTADPKSETGDAAEKAPPAEPKKTPAKKSGQIPVV